MHSPYERPIAEPDRRGGGTVALPISCMRTGASLRFSIRRSTTLAGRPHSRVSSAARTVVLKMTRLPRCPEYFEHLVHAMLLCDKPADAIAVPVIAVEPRLAMIVPLPPSVF
jgi:hypothetical protein